MEVFYLNVSLFYFNIYFYLNILCGWYNDLFWVLWARPYRCSSWTLLAYQPREAYWCLIVRSEFCKGVHHHPLVCLLLELLDARGTVTFSTINYIPCLNIILYISLYPLPSPHSWSHRALWALRLLSQLQSAFASKWRSRGFILNISPVSGYPLCLFNP